MSRLFRLVPALLGLAAGALPLHGVAQEPAGPVVRGEVIPADGGSVVGLWVRVRGAGLTDSVAVDAAGRFSLRVPDGLPGDRVELRVDSGDPALRRYVPSLVRASADSISGEHRLVLVPREWAIPSGRFTGTRVEIRLERAFKPLCEDCSAFYRRGYVGLDPRERSVIRTWPERVFPLRVAFDREASVDRIGARDSTAFWRIVDGMEETLGSDLFRPARYGETLPSEEVDHDDVILVRTDPTLRVSGLGSTAAQGTEIIYGELQVKWASLISGDGGESLVTHELMHTLGLGHTCAWRSVMAVPTRCPALKAPSLTAEDVAYAQLIRRVRELQRARGARWGIDAALAGERDLGSRE